jgi:hypothetical protein
MLENILMIKQLQLIKEVKEYFILAGNLANAQGLFTWEEQLF